MKASSTREFTVGATHRVARSTPSRPKMARASAWARAAVTPMSWPVPPSSPPQLYSVMASFVPGAWAAMMAFMRGTSWIACPIHDSST